MTKRDATQKWVGEFNAIPQSMIAKIWQNDIDDMHELTTPRGGDYVYHYPSQQGGEITNTDYETDYHTIRLNDDTIVTAHPDDFTVEHDDGLPMWGTMWSFGDSCDNWWLTDDDGIQIMSDHGFRIYEHEEFGYFFGIDGAGYNFIDEHFLPLYEARGLLWHDKEIEREPTKPSLKDTLTQNAERSKIEFGDSQSLPSKVQTMEV